MIRLLLQIKVRQVTESAFRWVVSAQYKYFSHKK